jgi:hypothetical protein
MNLREAARVVVDQFLDEGRSTPVISGTPSYERRASRFKKNVVPEYSTRVIPGGRIDQDGEIENARIQAGVRDYNDISGIAATRKRVFGNRFKNPNHELILTSILPTLAAHMDDKRISSEQRDIARGEFDRHIHAVAVGIHKSNLRRLKKHPVGQETGGFSNHDAIDHGVSGALPSNFGEIRGDHMKRLIQTINSHQDSEVLDHSSDLKDLKNDLAFFYSTQNARKFRLDNLAHDELMDWSRSFR